MEKEKSTEISELKKRYAELQKKHSLPSFEEMNKDFWIEEIAEVETDILIRKVRSKVGDALLAKGMRFIENLINPTGNSMFISSIVKLLDADDKKKLSDLYKQLMEREIEYIKLDMVFNEEREAKFIRESYEFWKTLRKSLLEILDKFAKRKEEKLVKNDSRDYFG